MNNTRVMAAWLVRNITREKLNNQSQIDYLIRNPELFQSLNQVIDPFTDGLSDELEAFQLIDLDLEQDPDLEEWEQILNSILESL